MTQTLIWLLTLLVSLSSPAMAGNAGFWQSSLAAESSVWDLSPFARGQSIEQTLGANLPQNFPVIDKFNWDTGVATSIKSIDLTAPSYQNMSTLSNTLNGYVNSVAGCYELNTQ
jgi:filamentous hemagglutinin